VRGDAVTAVDRVLLEYEFCDEVCVDCGGAERHDLGCQWDQALSERGYPTKADRDRARMSIAPTEPPGA
jgi:hypothetical protein